MLHNPTNANDALPLLNAAGLVQNFKQHTSLWHQIEPQSDAENETALHLHLTNFQLWHLEDSARDPLATDATIAQVKRTIDKTNQRRNDLVERFDAELLLALSASHLPAASAPMHSETPGLIVDRLSILALKIFHTDEQVRRENTSVEHRARNQQRLLVLQQQSADLATCLSCLWQEVCEGKRRYKLYQQLKMYNDPDLNPVLYTTTRP
ncbi:MAG: DUF4254 domain-containing protein [Janthinobacterium lividum]